MSQENVEIVRRALRGVRAPRTVDASALEQSWTPSRVRRRPDEGPDQRAIEVDESPRTGCGRRERRLGRVPTSRPIELIDAAATEVVVPSRQRRRPRGAASGVRGRPSRCCTSSATLRRRQGSSALQGLPRPRRGPRSRRACGVGDVAGERGDRARELSRRSTGGDFERCARAARPGDRVTTRPRMARAAASIAGTRRAAVIRRVDRQPGTTWSSSRGAHRRWATVSSCVRHVGGRGRGERRRRSSSACGSVWTVRERKVVRHRGLRDRAEALEAAGLSE